MKREGKVMAVSYKRLFHLMIDKGMTNAELMEKGGFSANIITRLKRNNYVALDSIEKICYALDCSVDDILEFIPDEKEQEKMTDTKAEGEPRARLWAQPVTVNCIHHIFQPSGQWRVSVMQWRVLCAGARLRTWTMPMRLTSGIWE
jgi:DNA-binding Xre family transcriptional regulator